MKQKVFSADRIQSLGDGVFAIAMTLLVLDLKLPPLGLSAEWSVVSAASWNRFRASSPGFSGSRSNE